MNIPPRKKPQTPESQPTGKALPIRKTALPPPQTLDRARDEASGMAGMKDISTRAKPTRKIDAATIAEMAKLCAKMLNESEACRRLGIRPKAWFDWKCRSNRCEKFAEMLEAFRADRIEQLIDRIEKSARGDDLKYPDWRAALALLKIADQKRFGDSPALDVHPATVINVQMIHESIKKIFGESEQPKLIEASKVKCIPPQNVIN